MSSEIKLSSAPHAGPDGVSDGDIGVMRPGPVRSGSGYSGPRADQPSVLLNLIH